MINMDVYNKPIRKEYIRDIFNCYHSMDNISNKKISNILISLPSINALEILYEDRKYNIISYIDNMEVWNNYMLLLIEWTYVINESSHVNINTAILRYIKEVINEMSSNNYVVNELSIHNLVVLSIQYCQRMHILQYGDPIFNIDNDSNEYIRKCKRMTSNFMNFVSKGISLQFMKHGKDWTYGTSPDDLFDNWRFVLAELNDSDIFNISSNVYNFMDHKRSSNISKSSKFTNTDLTNGIMLKSSNDVNISSLSAISSAQLREVKESNILYEPTFDVNDEALLKFMAITECSDDYKLNQLKFFSNDRVQIYNRVILETGNKSYLLIFDKNDDTQFCGIMLENGDDDNNYIKIKLPREGKYEYKYDRDNIIIANEGDIFKI